MIERETLQHEVDIVWIENVERLDYVREWILPLPRRRGRPGAGRYPGRLVGYTELAPDEPRIDDEGFWRRIFWLTPGDRDSEPDGVYARSGTPCEAVDPRTVSAGVPGRQTARSWGGPLEGSS